MTLVFMLIAVAGAFWVAQQLWDKGQAGLAIIVGLILVPFFIYLSFSIGSSLGLLKGGGGYEYGCYSEGPYGVKCD